MTRVIIHDGRVVGTVSGDAGIEIPDEFAAVPLDRLRFESGAFSVAAAELPDPEALKAGLVAYARDRRWQVEIGGISVDGVPVSTDDRSKLMIVGARLAAQADPDWSTIWQGADGGAYPVNGTAIVAISDAVQGHVNGSFATLAAVLVEIEAGTIATREEIDAAFATM